MIPDALFRYVPFSWLAHGFGTNPRCEKLVKYTNGSVILLKAIAILFITKAGIVATVSCD